MLSIVLVLLAAYVSFGRQFMPAISRYKTFVEEQITASMGIPATIDTLTGYFDGFDPVVSIQGLSLQVAATDATTTNSATALQFESASIKLNMYESFLQRQIILDSFVVQGLVVNARQSVDGSWQLTGVDIAQPAVFDIDSLFATLRRVAMLELTDLTIELSTLAGNTTVFRNSTAVIQNQQQNHFIHINTHMENSEQEVLISVELNGESLDEITGTVHAYLPNDNYTSVAENDRIGRVKFSEIQGGGNAWITLENGTLDQIVIQPEINQLGFAIDDGQQLVFSNIAGRAAYTYFGLDQGWSLVTENLEFRWNNRLWRSMDSYLGQNASGDLTGKAESLDLGILSEIAITSGAYSAAALQSLEDLQPQGILRNVRVLYPSTNNPESVVEISANIENLGLLPASGAPSFSGANGFLQVHSRNDDGLITGMVEVDSENFSLHVPRLFEEAWFYDYVNGRVQFEVSGSSAQQIMISSSIIAAESPIVDGRAKFSTRITRDEDGQIESNLELVIGASRADVGMKSSYLPTAETVQSGLRGTMLWLDDALIDGAVYESGVIFRGATHRDPPANSKHFQAFFEFRDGVLEFDSGWPELTGAEGLVLVDNHSTDVSVYTAATQGMRLEDGSAQIRRTANGENWLTIGLQASGSTDGGLDYLVNAPLNATVSKTLGDWRVDGEVMADIDLVIPLNIPDQEIKVGVTAGLQGSSISMPALALDFFDVSGNLSFDSDDGLSGTNLQSNFFGQNIIVDLQSTSSEEGTFVTDIEVSGMAEVRELRQWPKNNGFLQGLLDSSDGIFAYQAHLSVFQDDGLDTTAQLQLATDLTGVSNALPAPFGKTAEQPSPLNLQLAFNQSDIEIEGRLASALTFQIGLEESGQLDGIVYLGTLPGTANPWAPLSSEPGLELRGNLDVFNITEWLDFAEIQGEGLTAGQGGRDIRQWLSRVDINIASIDAFSQRLESVQLQMQNLEATDYWTVGVNSDAVAGVVLVPFEADDYIEAYLAYLRLPGSIDEEASSAGEDIANLPPEERVDPLENLDPRHFPKLKFFAGEVNIGDRSYGQGQFTLDPNPDGAEFSNLIVTFRGFDIGPRAGEEPRFEWRFDGAEHRSFLAGIVLADDLAEVLLANGFAASLESDNARFDADLSWPGSPAFFSAANLSGEVLLKIEDGRFLQGSGGAGALRLISILNFDALMRRLRFSDDLIRTGLAYEEITGDLLLQDGVVTINDRLVITGPSSVYQLTGQLDLANQTIDGDMFITLPLSDNIPWLGLLTANIPLAIGAYLFDRIFSEQVESLTSAQYSLQGPWDGLEPQFQQAFETPRGQNRNAPPAASGQSPGAVQ